MQVDLNYEESYDGFTDYNWSYAGTGAGAENQEFGPDTGFAGSESYGGDREVVIGFADVPGFPAITGFGEPSEPASEPADVGVGEVVAAGTVLDQPDLFFQDFQIRNDFNDQIENIWLIQMHFFFIYVFHADSVNSFITNVVVH